MKNSIDYKGFIIDYSKNYKNKISIFDINNNFYGDYYTIIAAKFAIFNKNLAQFQHNISILNLKITTAP